MRLLPEGDGVAAPERSSQGFCVSGALRASVAAAGTYAGRSEENATRRARAQRGRSGTSWGWLESTAQRTENAMVWSHALNRPRTATGGHGRTDVAQAR
jgi:hypothetical protein